MKPRLLFMKRLSGMRLRMFGLNVLAAKREGTQ